MGAEHRPEQLPHTLHLPWRIDLLDLVAELAQQLGGIVDGFRRRRVHHRVGHRRQGGGGDPQRPGLARGGARERLGGGGAQVASPASYPASTSSAAAVSATVRVSIPSIPSIESPSSGAEEMRPRCGFSPTRPQHAAGMRIEPPPSLPCATGTMPAATAAAEPPEEPPGVRSRSQGLRVAPNRRASLVGQDAVLGQRGGAHDDEAGVLQAARDVVVVAGHELAHQRAPVREAQALDRRGCS